ncbi:CHAT domain-containing protein [Nonomuraea spiralis]|uniref:CHAT domain-containing protein n=1 Tax=Nonomuraea spiralis TaxID=46182 RepID=A0ABV5IGP0_9ACTN|nr:CHAT domain-containing protein [Nonomuraea spiralis]GGS98268.1 hypothetical protein GCM10010176_047750 [Nonomuraea spiralis]
MDDLALVLFDYMLDLRNRGIYSEEEAVRRVRDLPPLGAGDAERAADRVKEPPLLLPEPAMILLQDMNVGVPLLFSTLEHRRNHFLLLHESLRPRDGGSLGPHRAVRDCLTATIDLLTDRHEPAVMDRGARLADAFAAATGSALAFNLAGRVHFEPYSPAAGSQSYEHDVAMRAFRRAWNSGMPRPASGTPDTFPGYDDSLERAEDCFRRAAALDDGVERGRALAYLALIDLTRAMTGRPPDLRQVERRLEEADRLLPTRADPTVWARLWLFAGDLRDPSVLLRAPRVHVRNAGQMIAEHGLHATAWLYLTAMELACGAADRDRLAVCSQHLRPFLPRTGMEQARLHAASLLLHALPGDPTGCGQHLTGMPPETFLDYGQPAAAVHALLHARYDGPTLDRVGAAARRGNGALSRAFSLARTISFDPVADPGDQEADPVATADAALGYLVENCPDTATVCLDGLPRQIRQLPARSGADVAHLLLRMVGLVGGAGVHLGDQGHRLIQQSLFEIVSLAAVRGFPDTDAIWLAAHQLAKGFVLAAALDGDRRPVDAMTQNVSQALRVHGTTGAELSAGAWQVNGGASAQLAAPVTVREGQPGADEAQTSANWRRVYHRTLARDLARAGMAADRPIRGLRQVQDVLGDSACLLSLLTGDMQGDYGNTVTAELITGRATEVVVTYSPGRPGLWGTMLLGGERGVIDLSVLFGGMPTLLDAVQEDALTRHLSREAEERLREEAGRLGPMLDWLSGLDDTVTTLYLWPHEAAHVLPFWLLPFGDGIVADRFTVSVLPCLAPLFRADAAAQEEGVLAVASAAGGTRYGLPYEESVERSAAGIAALFGGRALTGERATPAELLTRAGRTPYIHLAAHGMQDPDAPLFHCLFLAGEDGRLFADQILRCDLSAVRLVTIEACESLLMRYDYLDNLFGLPSMLLRAGAGAVAGACWSVRPEVSALFFATLYQHLYRSGEVGAAFAHAQALTRRAYPQYADWGAFCLVGHAG